MAMTSATSACPVSVVPAGVNVSSFCKLGTDGVLVKLLQGNKLRDLAMMK